MHILIARSPAALRARFLWSWRSFFANLRGMDPLFSASSSVAQGFMTVARARGRGVDSSSLGALESPLMPIKMDRAVMGEGAVDHR